MGILTTSTDLETATKDQTEIASLPSSEVLSMSEQTSSLAAGQDQTNIPGAVTLDQLNESRPVTRMNIDDYRNLTQEQRDDLSGNYIEFPTAKQPVPALLAPIWNQLTPAQQQQYAGDPNSQKDLRITQYPSNQRIAENEQKHAEQRALMNQQQQQQQVTQPQPTPEVTPTTPVEAPKPDTARLESLAKEYVNSVYSKFRGTDPKAPETAIYKSLKNATDPEIVKIRELLYGKTDGGQDSDSGLYDVFRNGKESAETVMKRLENVPGATAEEKFKYLEDALEKVKQYKADFEKPKAPVQQPVQPAPDDSTTKPPVTSSQSFTPLESGVVSSNVPVVQNSTVTQNRSLVFNPADTDDVVARMQAGEDLPIRTVEDMKVALRGLKNAGQTDWYEYLEMQAKLKFGEGVS